MTLGDQIAVIVTYVVLMGLMIFVVGTARADTIYWHYEDCDGVLTYTDKEPVPKYREEAELEITGPLEDYERFTKDDFPFVPTPSATTPTGSTTSVAPLAADATPSKPERRRKRHRSDRNPR